MPGPLDNRVVLVTGGAVRVGRSLSEAVGAAGARVAVHYCHSEAGANETVQGLRGRGLVAQAFHADLTQRSDIDALVSAVEKALGPVDGLVNSAAAFERKPFLETEDGLLDGQWALNARAPYLLSRQVARGMLARGRGDIVNILDVGGALRPWRGYSAYCMTKAALTALTQCLAIELAPAVRVNGVAPGTVLPPESMDEATVERLRQKIPLQRLGAPEDIASAVVYLLTGNSYITGQVLAVDGGRSLT